MHERLEKIKTHVKENKVVYIVGASCLATGAAIGGAIVYLKFNGGNVDGSVAVTQGLAYKSPVTITNTTIVELVRRGHPGYKIQCMTTGEEFASIRRAADMLGINRNDLQEHLRGLRPVVNGMTFQNLGEM